ncbi:MAG: hypothetical protein ACQER5_05610 [Pseudomonadota bacterium]
MAKDLNLSVTLKAINKATGPLKKILQGSRGVGRAMKETRAELKDFNDQQKRISAYRGMTQQSKETRDALREKRQELDRVTQELKTATGPTKRLTNQQAKAQAAVDKLNHEYRDQRDRVRELAKGLPRAEDGTRGLTAQQEALDRQIRATNERLNNQRNALQRLSDADVSGKFRNMTGEIGRLGRRALMAGGAAAGGIFALANSTATLGDDVAKTSAKIGIGAGELQELRYAAERSGVSTQKLDSSTERFVKRLGEARQGGGAAAKAYEQLGLDANKLAELTPAQSLRVVADELAQVENHSDRVALAAKFFGREGVAMVNMLKDGSAGLDQYARDARAVGYVLGDEAPGQAEVFQDALLDAQSNLKGMKNTIGAELMPAISELMRDLSSWMRENRDEVKQFAKSFGDNLKAAVPIITDLAKGTARLATGIGEVVSRLAGMVGGYDNLAMIAGGLFASKALFSVVSFGTALVKAGAAMAAFAKTLPLVSGAIKALGVAFAATPIGWLVAGITAVAGGAYYLYKNWDWIGPWFGELWDGIKAKAGAAWDWFKSLFDWSPRQLIASAWSGLGDIVSGALELAKAVAGRVWEGLKMLFRWSPVGLLVRAWQGISDTIGSPLELAKAAAGRVWDGLKTLFRWSPVGLLVRAWQGISDTIGSPLELAKATAARVWDGLKALFQWSPVGLLVRAWQGISDTIGSPLELAKAAAGRVWEGLKDLFRWSPIATIRDAWSGLRALGGELINGLIGGIDERWQALKAKITAMAEGVIDWFKGVLGIASPSRVFAGFGGDIVQGIINGISGMAGALKDQVVGLAGDIANWMKDAIGSAWESGKEIAKGIGEGAKNGALAAGRAVRDGAVAASRAVQEGAGNAWEVGKDTARGMGEGIKDGAGWVWQQAKGLAGGTEQAARYELDTHSPSRVFASIGRDVTAGLALGIREQQAAPAREVSSLTQRLRQAGAGLALGTATLAGPAAAGDGAPQAPAALELYRSELITQQLELPDLPALGVERPETATQRLAVPHLPMLGVERPEGIAQRLEVPRLPTLGVERPESSTQRLEIPKLPRLGVERPEGIAQRLQLPEIPALGIEDGAPSFDTRPPLTTPAGGDVNITIGDINVQAAPGMDEQALARYVASEVQRALEQAEHRAAVRRRSAFHDID